MTDAASQIVSGLERFGHADFRPGQREAVEGALDGKDVIAVMPTGAGKSLCYQLPALASEGLTLVISPLVALMDDQISSLEKIAPGEVAAVHGLKDQEENDQALEDAASGKLRLLYLAPERLANSRVARAIQSATVERVVVDEAHCVSSWGHDFRPDYFRLGEAARRLGAANISAFTATATPRVAEDIAIRLGLKDAAVVRTGFDRPNISFTVVTCDGSADEQARLLRVLEDPSSRPAIVYAGTRKQADAMAPMLSKKLGVKAEAYHAGLERKKRGAVQTRFMTDKTEIVVATNAFGMGVDKADVRTVVHISVPGSLEAVYQEAGRAGRDGLPARAVLLAEPRDRSLHVHFIKSAAVEDEQLKAVFKLLKNAADENGLARIPARSASRACAGGQERATAAIGHLAFAGAIAPIPAPPNEIAARITGGFDGEALSRARAAAADAQKLRWQRYKDVWGFVDSEGCRRRDILTHFGDKREPSPEGPCCDRCDATLVPKGASAKAKAAAKASGSGGVAVVLSTADAGELAEAIIATVTEAQPTIGRTRLGEILRGSRGKALVGSGQDQLPQYGRFASLSHNSILALADEMLGDGRLKSTGGRFPKLALP